jgi:SH3-like domain-containing protein
MMRFFAAVALAAALYPAAFAAEPLPQPKPAAIAALGPSVPAEAPAAAAQPDARALAPQATIMAVAAAEPKPRPEPRTGESGLPVPRFAALKSDEVRMRAGPSTGHEVIWVYTRRGLPVEIVAEDGNWRRIRDPDGITGWVNKSLLDGRRRVMIIGQENAPMLDGPQAQAVPIALLAPGVIARLHACDGLWCSIEAANVNGYVPRDAVWGVYADETVD